MTQLLQTAFEEATNFRQQLAQLPKPVQWLARTAVVL
jgi:hypothetical protein